MTDYLLKLLVSLGVVLLAIVFLLPLFLRRFYPIRGKGKGSFEVKKIAPLTKDIYIVELEVKGKTFVLCVSPKGADLIYRDEDEKSANSFSSDTTHNLGSGENTSPDRNKDRGRES